MVAAALGSLIFGTVALLLWCGPVAGLYGRSVPRIPE